MDFNYLFKPLQVGAMTLKNRVVMTAIHLFYSEDGSVNERLKQFYFKRCEGGISMAIVGGVASDNYVGYGSMLRLDEDKYIPGFAELAEGFHKRGAKLCVQLLQTGRYGSAIFVEGDESILSASAVVSKLSGDLPREMTIAEIKTAQKRAGEAAARAKKAGADCVELTAGSGYLISQFLSPLTNLRTDEYGGSWENRCRFGLEMISELKAQVGEDFPIIVRVAGNEFMDGGNGYAECVDFCKKLEQAGVAMIDVTGGWHETVIPQLPGELPRGGFVYLSKMVKDAVSIPVLSANRHNDPKECELTLALGQADVIGQMRTLIADPDWLNKVQSGKKDLIRKCVACNQGCFAHVFSRRPCECLLNPQVGNEYLHTEAVQKKSKNLLVIGAGVAGCEFAYRAAMDGHKVSLYEKNSVIGGKIPLVAAPPAKREFANLVDYYKNILADAKVNLVLNTEVTAEFIKAGGYDEVIIASGSSPKKFKLPGSDSIPVLTADEILSGNKLCGKNVVVVGGGSVGCETADYLAHEGSLTEEKLYFMMSQQSESPETIGKLLNSSDRNIAIVDIAKIGANFDFGCGWPVMKDLRRLGVKMFPMSKVLNTTDNSVIIEFTDRKSGNVVSKELPCDTIVMSVGYASDNTLYEQLQGTGIKLHNIGDSQTVGNILGAIKQA
ncbi:MAG: FAD-dependent oxidoreductase, partial [Oscillospiraceae bacterium]